MAKEYIERQALPHKRERGFFLDEEFNAGWNACLHEIEKLPAADVREVVLCGECYLHTHCRTEDVFDFAGLREENRFCSIGKRKTNSAKMEVQDG